MGAELGFAAGEIAPVHVHDERVSSTRIREALVAGDFGHAATLLGRPYAIGGRVVRGRQLGRTLGFPTANLRFPKAPALSGIYATWVHGVAPRPWPSVSSFGTRPTVEGVEPLLEAHLFDFAGDLYGRHLQVEFVAKLRDEEKFPDLPALTAQMHRDAAEARCIQGQVPRNRRQVLVRASTVRVLCRIPHIPVRTFQHQPPRDGRRRDPDYKATLHLPATEFPMRGDLPKREPDTPGPLGSRRPVRAAARPCPWPAAVRVARRPPTPTARSTWAMRSTRS